MALPFQLSIFDSGEDVFIMAYFVLDGVPHFIICDVVHVRDANDGSVSSHFKRLNSSL